jgi:hypothetical protein
VHRTIQQYRAAQQAQSSPDDELAAESAAVLAKYGGGFDADEFDIADAPTELRERFERMVSTSPTRPPSRVWPSWSKIRLTLWPIGG